MTLALFEDGISLHRIKSSSQVKEPLKVRRKAMCDETGNTSNVSTKKIKAKKTNLGPFLKSLKYQYIQIFILILFSCGCQKQMMPKTRNNITTNTTQKLVTSKTKNSPTLYKNLSGQKFLLTPKILYRQLLSGVIETEQDYKKTKISIVRSTHGSFLAIVSSSRRRIYIFHIDKDLKKHHLIHSFKNARAKISYGSQRVMIWKGDGFDGHASSYLLLDWHGKKLWEIKPNQLFCRFKFEDKTITQIFKPESIFFIEKSQSTILSGNGSTTLPLAGFVKFDTNGKRLGCYTDIKSRAEAAAAGGRKHSFLIYTSSLAELKASKLHDTKRRVIQILDTKTMTVARTIDLPNDQEGFRCVVGREFFAVMTRPYEKHKWSNHIISRIHIFQIKSMSKVRTINYLFKSKIKIEYGSAFSPPDSNDLVIERFVGSTLIHMNSSKRDYSTEDKFLGSPSWHDRFMFKTRIRFSTHPYLNRKVWLLNKGSEIAIEINFIGAKKGLYIITTVGTVF